MVDLVALWADTVQLGLLTDVRDGQRVSLEELTVVPKRVMNVIWHASGPDLPAVLAILVVRATTNRQEERRRRYERGELPVVPGSPGEQPLPAAAAQPG